MPGGVTEELQSMRTGIISEFVTANWVKETISSSDIRAVEILVFYLIAVVIAVLLCMSHACMLRSVVKVVLIAMLEQILCGNEDKINTVVQCISCQDWLKELTSY